MSLKRSTIIIFTVIFVSNITSILLIRPNYPGLLTLFPLPKLLIETCMPKGFPISNMCLCCNGSFKFVFHCINRLFYYWLKFPSPVFAGPCSILEYLHHSQVVSRGGGHQRNQEYLFETNRWFSYCQFHYKQNIPNIYKL